MNPDNFIDLISQLQNSVFINNNEVLSIKEIFEQKIHIEPDNYLCDFVNSIVEILIKYDLSIDKISRAHLYELCLIYIIGIDKKFTIDEYETYIKSIDIYLRYLYIRKHYIEIENKQFMLICDFYKYMFENSHINITIFDKYFDIDTINFNLLIKNLMCGWEYAY